MAENEINRKPLFVFDERSEISSKEAVLRGLPESLEQGGRQDAAAGNAKNIEG